MRHIINTAIIYAEALINFRGQKANFSGTYRLLNWPLLSNRRYLKRRIHRGDARAMTDLLGL